MEQIHQILIEGVSYDVQSDNHTDQVFYHVTKRGEFLCTLAINENGVWEADCDIDETLVKAIGEQIENAEI